jgi:hypothetical protein
MVNPKPPICFSVKRAMPIATATIANFNPTKPIKDMRNDVNDNK